MNSPECIMPGFKLVLASGDFIASIYPEKKRDVENHALNFKQALWREYFAVRDLLYKMLGRESLVVVKGKILTNHTEYLEQAEIPWLQSHYRDWTRDALTQANGETILFNEAWKAGENWMPGSPLGEGGTVLVRRNAIVVGEETAYGSSLEIEELEQEGYKVATLPPVTNPRSGFIPHHVDGQATLLETKTGELVLIIARSYEKQDDGKTADATSLAAETIGAHKIVIDDRRLPPLALNLIQFDDFSIAMTAGAPRLENLLKGLVGKDRVFTTDTPIRLIPSNTEGGIRCMTNIFPEALITPVS